MRTIGINLPKEDARVGGHAKDLRERQVKGGAAEDSRGAPRRVVGDSRGNSFPLLRGEPLYFQRGRQRQRRYADEL